MDRHRQNPHPCGFTRLELLVVLATIVLLATLTRPAWGNPTASRSIVCLDNFRQLARAWLLYADDQEGRLPRNTTVLESQVPIPGRIGWVSGIMTWDTMPQNTNRAYLVDPRYAALAPYTGPDAALYKCPEDTYLSPQQVARGWNERVRSYAMSHFMGAPVEFVVRYRYFRKLSDLRTLPPQRAAVFLEEHPDSINDPTFVIQPATPIWLDLPASFHNGACRFSFADGHTELRRWESPATIQPVRFFYRDPPPVRPGDPDWGWVQERSSERN